MPRKRGPPSSIWKLLGRVPWGWRGSGGWLGISSLSSEFSMALESFLWRYKWRAELGEMGEVKETDHGAKNDPFRKIYFVGHLYTETFLFPARGGGELQAALWGYVSEAPLVVRGHGRRIPDLSSNGTLWGHWSGRKWSLPLSDVLHVFAMLILWLQRS